MSGDGEGKVHKVPASSFRKGAHHEHKDDGAAIVAEKKTGDIKVDVDEKTMTEEEKLDAMPPIKLLLHAASVGDEAGVRKALERGAKVNETDPGPVIAKTEKGGNDEEKKAAVYRDYIYTGDAAIHKAAEAGHVHIINFLWLKEADVDLKNRIGSTALHKAVSNNKAAVVSELLTRQARVDITNNIGNTPLHCAAYSGNVEIAKLLLDGGAWRTLPVTNKANMLPIDYARKKTMQELLEQYTKQFHLASASFHRLPSVGINKTDTVATGSQKHLVPPGGAHGSLRQTPASEESKGVTAEKKEKHVTMHLGNVSFSAKKKSEKRADVVEEQEEAGSDNEATAATGLTFHEDAH